MPIKEFVFAKAIPSKFQSMTLTLVVNLDRVERGGLYSASSVVFNSGYRAGVETGWRPKSAVWSAGDAGQLQPWHSLGPGCVTL